MHSLSSRYSRRDWLARIAFGLPGTLAALPGSAAGRASNPSWDRARIFRVPATHPAPDLGGVGVRSLFLEGPPFQGRPTRVFAFYGLPSDRPKGRVPAMVLVHGGGGTAFADWVRLWTGRGYAAIAMDTCGCVPIGKYGDWQRHEHGGPPGWGGFDQTERPLEDQWMHQAVSTVVVAHSWLGAQPEIDPKRIGLTGISWGGVLTCVVAGIDSRFRFAAPVYGCGFFGGNAVNGTLDGMFDARRPEACARWLRWWDPRWYLAEARMPFLWVNGTNDFAFPMPAWRASARLPRGPRTLCLRVRMPHAHGGAGENPEEIRAFADAWCRGGRPLAEIRRCTRRGRQIEARYLAASPVVRAELCFTRASGRWQDRLWESQPATLDPRSSRARAELPEGGRVWFLNLVDDRGRVVSTEHAEL